jgi:hypothetical protein
MMELDRQPAIISSKSCRPDHQRNTAMKTLPTLLAVAGIMLAANAADAKGCLKGAAVGGAAGHFAGHHGVIGAIAGCAYGRHQAKERQQQTNTPAGSPATDRDKI